MRGVAKSPRPLPSWWLSSRSPMPFYMNRSAILLPAMSALFVLSACSSSPPQADGLPGLANPASEFCVKQKNGESFNLTDQAGNQRGMCRLPDGRVVDEWELFRQEAGGG